METSSLFSGSITWNGEEIRNMPDLISFYQERGYELAWTKDKNASELITAINHSSDEGLWPEDYHSKIFEKYFFQNKKSTSEEILLDIFLSDAFLIYASHLHEGKVNPESLYPGKWERVIKRKPYVSILKEAIHQNSILSAFQNLKPQQGGYHQLKSQLKFFQSLEDSSCWPSLSIGKTILCEDEDERIPDIRKRLQRFGFLQPFSPENPLRYDSGMLIAIINFQYQHGLKPDGVIGEQTQLELNTPIETYLKKIIVNLERYRWMDEPVENQSVVVNIPSFYLDVFSGREKRLSMKTIVGRPERSTPVLNQEIRYIIINPTWTVPPTILKEDILPQIKKDINFLKRNNLKVLDRKGEEVDPFNLNWESFTHKNFPYMLQQPPGDYNSMGLIKFQFPNEYKIFLHDTNKPTLFFENYRALSSGCIRVERPLHLAVFLLKESSWTEEKIRQAVSKNKTITIPLEKPFPIRIMYLTAWVDDQNFLQFRKDLYQLDERLFEALRKGP